MGQPLLVVEDLRTYFYTRRGVVKAVDGVSFKVNQGEIVALVGESGCGKSVTCLSLLRLVLQPAGRIVGGKVLFEGEDLLVKSEREMRAFRGERISMIFQDPLTSLNPVYTIGDQVSESFLFHALDKRSVKRNLKDQVIGVLRQVKISSPEMRLKSYPFEFSGGMRQRVAAAMSLACRPHLMLADEPTTSLDVTVQAQFLQLLSETSRQTGMAIILVTHDLGIVAQICDRVCVMYAGRIVESGSVRRLFTNPAHPYTVALMESVPRLGAKRESLFQIEGQPPSLIDLPPGCSFALRCDKALDICRKEYPPEVFLGNGDYAKCWLLVDRCV
jgi:oligopeptide/dipeptide ABC transporter ATP-binding protein